MSYWQSVMQTMLDCKQLIVAIRLSRLSFAAFLTAFVLLLTQAASAADKVVLQLRWDHQFQFAGYYAALWKGYYSDAGLEVTIRTPFKEGGGIVNSVDEVVSGRADFGIGAADFLVARDKGKPVVALSTFFYESAVEFYVNWHSGYSSLGDLPRLRVARRIGDLLDTEFQAMLKLSRLEMLAEQGRKWIVEHLIDGYTP